MSKRSSLVRVAATVALALGLTACGNGDGGDGANAPLPPEFTVTSRGPLPDFTNAEIAAACASLEPVLDLKARSAAAGSGVDEALSDPDVLADPDQVDELYVALTDLTDIAEESVTFYDQAADELPAALATDVAAISVGTAQFIPVVREILEARPPGEELVVRMQAVVTDPALAAAATDAATATLRLDQFTEPNCGFLVSDS
jgi:hypothetical protein